jgi:hypothetical protein
VALKEGPSAAATRIFRSEAKLSEAAASLQRKNFPDITGAKTGANSVALQSRVKRPLHHRRMRADVTLLPGAFREFQFHE